MKCKIRSLALAVALLASAAANSTTFDFSYTFGDGTAVTGSFDGDSDGYSVNNLSNLSVFANGVLLSNGGSWHAYAPDGSHPGAVNFDGTNNGFIFSSDSFGSEIFSIFNVTTDPDNRALLDAQTITAVDYADADTIASRWSLVVAGTAPVGAVPEPGTCAMLLAGLGVLGFMARRRLS